jgi:hypothetical protein
MNTFKQFLAENYSYYAIYYVITLSREMSETEIIDALKKALGNCEDVYVHGLRRKGDLKDLKHDLISDLSDDPEVANHVKELLKKEKMYPRGHQVHADVTVKSSRSSHASFVLPSLQLRYREALEKVFGYGTVKIFDGEDLILPETSNPT